MRICLRKHSWPILLSGAFAISGCGLISGNFDAELRADFIVDGTGHLFEKELTVNPADYPDVEDNCGAIEKETGQIRTMTVEVLTVNQNNKATYGHGEVYMRHATETPWPADDPANAFASFQDTPLLTGQVITLDMTPARRKALAELVFTENCDRALQIRMVGASDAGPVSFSGRVTFFVDFVAGG